MLVGLGDVNDINFVIRCDIDLGVVIEPQITVESNVNVTSVFPFLKLFSAA